MLDFHLKSRLSTSKPTNGGFILAKLPKGAHMPYIVFQKNLVNPIVKCYELSKALVANWCNSILQYDHCPKWLLFYLLEWF
jgi:hypothetical protein